MFQSILFLHQNFNETGPGFDNDDIISGKTCFPYG